MEYFIGKVVKNTKRGIVVKNECNKQEVECLRVNPLNKDEREQNYLIKKGLEVLVLVFNDTYLCMGSTIQSLTDSDIYKKNAKDTEKTLIENNKVEVKSENINIENKKEVRIKTSSLNIDNGDNELITTLEELAKELSSLASTASGISTMGLGNMGMLVISNLQPDAKASLQLHSSNLQAIADKLRAFKP